MKRIVLINLICSLIVVMAILFGICFVVMFGELDLPASNEGANINSQDSGSGEMVKLNLSGKITGGANTSEAVFFTILADNTDSAYLKIMSYGDYDHETQSFLPINSYGKLMDGERSAYYLPAAALDNSGLNTYHASISSKQGYYAIPYYTADGGIIQSSDVAMTGDLSEYEVEYFACSNLSGVKLPSAYTAYEEEYYQFVKDNYLYIDTETYDYMNTIISEQGFSVSDGDIISKVARYIQSAATYKLEYNPEMDNEDNIPIAFLSEYKEGVCRHYALAATMMFRTLGMPARYTTGFSASTISGKQVEVTGKMAHAWVEVYVKGIGWISVEVTGGGDGDGGDGGDEGGGDGIFDSESPEVTKLIITPQAQRSPYREGYELCAKATVDGFTELAAKGYKYNSIVSGSISTLGIAESEVLEFEIFSPDGELVYKKTTGFGSDKFKVTYRKGVIQQYIAHLTFSSTGETKTYDGSEIKTKLSNCRLVSGNINSKEGYSYTITPTGVNDSVGTVSATYTVTVFKDGVDCTSHFWITTNYGKLTINAREITISAKSAEQQFNGMALTCNSIDYNASLLAKGDYIGEFVVEGSQKNIGSSANVLKSVKIVNANGEDVTHNYKITIRDGLLTVFAPTK